MGINLSALSKSRDLCLSDLDYSFPPELVSPFPPEKRESARMMCVDSRSAKIENRRFLEFPDFLSAGDVLVLNNSRVLPCRLTAKKKTGGAVEILLIRETEPFVWECLVGGKKIPAGAEFVFSPDLSGVIPEDGEDLRKIRLYHEGSLFPILEKTGHMPLPPYLKRDDLPLDRLRYQTVYAKHAGSVAAPTAGFHFTRDVLCLIEEKGVHVVFLTLHVGIGTFLPIRTSIIKNHHMHGEYYEIPEKTAEIIRSAKMDSRPVSAVGTTTVRALESAWDADCLVKDGKGYTEKFIYPPFSFRLVDRMLTNFHQPKSALLALVSAFAGINVMQNAYREAVRKKYRLFSFGDCMWIY